MNEEKKETKKEEKKPPTKRPKKGLSAQDMSEADMDILLIELSDSAFWQAIMRFVDVRCGLIENSLCSLDAFKFPTDVARNQGMRIGLLDLYSYVVDKQEDRKKEEEAINAK